MSKKRRYLHKRRSLDRRSRQLQVARYLDLRRMGGLDVHARAERDAELARIYIAMTHKQQVQEVERAEKATTALFTAIQAQFDLWLILTRLSAIARYAQGELLRAGVAPILEELAEAFVKSVRTNNELIQLGQDSLFDVDDLTQMVDKYKRGISAAITGDGGKALRQCKFDHDLAYLRRSLRVGTKPQMARWRQQIAKQAIDIDPGNEKTFYEKAQALIGLIDAGRFEDSNGEIRAWLQTVRKNGTKLGNLVREYEQYLADGIVYR